jgi:hypothetical protein
MNRLASDGVGQSHVAQPSQQDTPLSPRLTLDGRGCEEHLGWSARNNYHHNKKMTKFIQLGSHRMNKYCSSRAPTRHFWRISACSVSDSPGFCGGHGCLLRVMLLEAYRVNTESQRYLSCG